MKATLLAALAPLALLAACAGAPAQRTTVASSPPAGTQYCWKERLSAERDGYFCNWASSVADACRSTDFRAVPRGAVASGPSDARRRCDNGEWLVQITTK